ncbi:MAG: CHAT domain-containing protein [Desulfobacterales bacterium]|nr:CHAT domain-containing protein [Desulfobacterales bacterium]
MSSTDIEIKGNQLLKSGHFREALEKYITVIKNGEDKASSFYNLGLAYEALDRPVHAYMAFREAVKRLPGAEAHRIRPKFETSLQRFQSNWRKAGNMTLDDLLTPPKQDQDEAFQDKIIMHGTDKKIRKAARKITAKCNGIGCFFEESQKAYIEGKKELAVAILEEAVYFQVSFKGKGDTFGFIVKILTETGDFEKALSYVNRAICFNSESREIQGFCTLLLCHLMGYRNKREDVGDLYYTSKFHELIGMWEHTLHRPDLSTVEEDLQRHEEFGNHIQEIAKDVIEYLEYVLSGWEELILGKNLENSPDLISSLGNKLMSRFNRTGSSQYLEAAIGAYERALKLASKDSPDLFFYRKNLDTALGKRSVSKGKSEDLNHMSVADELKAARIQMHESLVSHNWKDAVMCYRQMHQASKRLLGVQSSREQLEKCLKETQGTASEGAYALAKENQLQDAVMVLEHGLARLLSEPVLSGRFIKRTGIADIRFADVQKAAQAAPLVYIAATEIGGIALVVQDTVRSVWLPRLTNTELKKFLVGSGEEDFLNSYLGTYDAWRKNLDNEDNKNAWYAVLEEVTRWLWQVVMGPLIENLGANCRIKLIPAGLLTLLPLHAAWTYDETTPTGRKYALDVLRISYAPNAGTLAEATSIAKQICPDSILAVDDPELPTDKQLLYSQYEVESAVSTFSENRCQVLRRGSATRDAVLKELPHYSVLHFSCHGITDFTNSLNSGLWMAYEEFLSLKDLWELRLKGVRMATLSACETGIPGVQLPDEVVNLASGLLQAGAAGVVSSLWLVSDLSTMMLMTRFYDNWREKKLEPVEALRQAQIWVRDSTNGEKLDYFKELEKAQSGKSKISHDALKWIHKAIRFSDPDFTNPYYWAAFQYTGV